MPAETAVTPKPWRSPLEEARGPGEPGFFHDGVDLAPGGHPAPGPETDILTFAAFRLHFTNAMHQVKRLKEGRGDGDGAMDTGAALLKALEDEDAGSEIDAIGGEGQGLREAAAGIGQGHAESPAGAAGDAVAFLDGRRGPGRAASGRAGVPNVVTCSAAFFPAGFVAAIGLRVMTDDPGSRADAWRGGSLRAHCRRRRDRGADRGDGGLRCRPGPIGA